MAVDAVAQETPRFRLMLADAFGSAGFASEELFAEILGLVLELLKTGPRGQRL